MIVAASSSRTSGGLHPTRHAAAKVADATKGAEFGVEKRGDELPDWLADIDKRTEKIREVQPELEAEAKSMAEAEQRRRAEVDTKRLPQGRKRPARNPRPSARSPNPARHSERKRSMTIIMKSTCALRQALRARCDE